MLFLNCSALLIAGLLPAQQSDFVGSGACSGCHRGIYESYMRTGMGHSMRPASNLNLPAAAELGHAGLDRRLRVFRQDKDLTKASTLSMHPVIGSLKIRTSWSSQSAPA